MTTATTSQHRSFPASLALAAASAAVVVGGLTAYGISESKDSTPPTHSQVGTSTNDSSQHHGYGTKFGSHEPKLKGGQPTLKGGHTTIGLP